MLNVEWVCLALEHLKMQKKWQSVDPDQTVTRLIWFRFMSNRVQLRMISVDNFFRIFEIIIFFFVVVICELVHAVEAAYGLP